MNIKRNIAILIPLILLIILASYFFMKSHTNSSQLTELYKEFPNRPRHTDWPDYFFARDMAEAVILCNTNKMQEIYDRGGNFGSINTKSENLNILAIKWDRKECFDKQLQLEQGYGIDEMLLAEAISSDNPYYLTQLLKYKPDLSKYTVFPVLHHAVMSEKTWAVKQVLDAGADVNQVDQGWTALDLAVIRSNKEIVELLKQKGAKTAKELTK